MTSRPVEVEDTLTMLWSAVAQAHFLSTLTIYEALAVLEKRSTLVQSLLNQNDIWIEPQSEAISCMMDHFHTLLEAEMDWLERALTSLQASHET